MIITSMKKTGLRKTPPSQWIVKFTMSTQILKFKPATKTYWHRSLQARTPFTTEEVHQATHLLLLQSQVKSNQIFVMIQSTTFTMEVIKLGTMLKGTANREEDT